MVDQEKSFFPYSSNKDYEVEEFLVQIGVGVQINHMNSSFLNIAVGGKSSASGNEVPEGAPSRWYSMNRTDVEELIVVLQYALKEMDK